MPLVLAVSNQKCGVGKTTTAINLSASLTLNQQKVLLIDLDPEGHTSSGLGFPKSKNEMGISDVLLRKCDLKHILKQVELTQHHPLYVAPVSSFCAASLHALECMPNRELLLESALSELLTQETFDYIIIDCPSSLDILTTNAFCAAQELFIPIQAEYYALKNINELLLHLQRTKLAFHSTIEVGAVLLTMVTPSTLSQDVIEQVNIFFGPEYCLSRVIPRDSALIDSASRGKCIFQHDAQSVAAAAYLDVAHQLQLRHEKINGASLHLRKAHL